jgi:hypothetical protein
MSLDAIQSIIDDNKEELGDGSYLKLCALTKQLCNESNMYMITYINTNIVIIPKDDELELEHVTKKGYYRISSNLVSYIKSTIEDDGYVEMNNLDNMDNLNNPDHLNSIYIYNHCGSDENCCDDCVHLKKCQKILQYKNSKIILKIEEYVAE